MAKYQRKDIPEGDTLRQHLSRAGLKGGSSKSEAKTASSNANLVAAYKKRWPNRPLPPSLQQP